MSKIRKEFLDIGCNYIVLGDLENPALQLYKNLEEKKPISEVKGLISKDFSNDKIDFVENLDDLNIPAWEDFPLDNYWNLGYAHGPLSSKKYSNLEF